MTRTRSLPLLLSLGVLSCQSDPPLAMQPAREPTPALRGDESLAAAQRHIARREYRASRNRHGLQAPNRAHNLRTYFESTGIRVHDRTGNGSPELLALRLEGVGREGALAPVVPGEVVDEGARVEIRRPELVEWYENAPAGLEQGFTLGVRPPGSGPLVLELAVTGSEATLQGDAVVFRSPTGRRLRYGEFVAVDAEGRSLEARIAVPAAGRVQLQVGDGDATYPIVLDPILTGVWDAQLQADQADAELGWSVAGAGDVDGDGHADVVVGAPNYDAGEANEGAAFIFLGSAAGIADGSPATADAQLESDQAGAELGWSVAGAGDVNGDGYADVIVGAPFYASGQNAEGAAFVFLGSAAGIADGSPATAHAQLEADQTSAYLGRSVAGAGDVDGDGYADVIVGAPFYDSGENAEGAAFVFRGSAAGIADGSPATADTQLESDQANAFLGADVAGAGDVDGDGYADVIVGADSYSAGQSDEGAAFIFLGGATGIADGSPVTAHAQLESDQEFAGMGASVAAAGDVDGDGYADVIVGAPFYDAIENIEGAAFVFRGSAAGIADGSPATADTQLESDQEGAELGISVAGAGDVNGDGYADVIVGAYFYNGVYDGGGAQEGGAFVFLGSASGVADATAATAHAGFESDQAGARLGISVAGAGDVNGDGYADVIVGAYLYDAGQNDEGSAFVFLGGSAGIRDGSPADADAQLAADQADAELGISVAGAGDVNGDGYADVIVGASGYDAGEANEGAAFVLLGGASGIASGGPATADTQLESDQAEASFGERVAGAGDVNGDGYADVIVGAQRYDAGENNEGGAFVFLGGPAGIADANPATAHARIQSDQNGGRLGSSVAGAGDVNGDGYADVIVGASLYNGGENNEGAAFVFLGGPAGIADANPATAHARLEADQADAELGISVAGAGDVNGDGYADVIVGANGYDAGQTDEGAAFVFLGSASGIADGSPATAHAQLESDQADAELGISVGGAGDVDGDGYADVIVGAYLYDAGENNEGAAFVFLGSASGIADGSPATAHARLEADQNGARLGNAVTGAGDVDGDGYADVIVGAYLYNGGENNEGAAFVFLGSASGIADGSPATAHARLEADQAGAEFGIGVAGAGDVDGDGHGEVIVGAHRYDAGETDEGTSFVYLADGDTGRPVLARQARVDSAAVIVQPWGRSGAIDAIRIGLTASHPAGRGRVKLEAEACPPGTPFGDAGCTAYGSPAWVEVAPPGAAAVFSETVGGLSADTLYRWRARVLHAPASVTAAGITAPPNPAHGPWRRVSAQEREADVRTVPEPGLGTSLVSGLLLLAVLGRRERLRRAVSPGASR